jgi:hypothetical protein
MTKVLMKIDYIWMIYLIKSIKFYSLFICVQKINGGENEVNDELQTQVTFWLWFTWDWENIIKSNHYGF